MQVGLRHFDSQTLDWLAGALRSGLGFGAGLSRPTIAVESREMCPTSVPSYAALTSAPCTRSGSLVSANHAKARERAGALGISETRRPAAQPPQRWVVPEPVDQGPCGREVPHRLRQEGTRQRVPAAPGADFLLPRPYHSWERGPTGRTNGLVRGYLPKGTDLPGKWRTPR